LGLKFSGVTILQGVGFSVFLLILARALQQCRATALPVIAERDNVTFGYMLSQIRLSVVCNVHPTQGVELFGNISSPLCALPTSELRAKFYGDRPNGTLRRV